MSEWAPIFIAKLSDWARSEGCSAITGNGRKGWQRIVARLGGERIADREGLPCWRLRLQAPVAIRTTSTKGGAQ